MKREEQHHERQRDCAEPPCTSPSKSIEDLGAQPGQPSNHSPKCPKQTLTNPNLTITTVSPASNASKEAAAPRFAGERASGDGRSGARVQV